MSPLGYFGFCLVEVSPVVGCVVAVVSSIMFGRSVCIPRVNAICWWLGCLLLVWGG